MFIFRIQQNCQIGSHNHMTTDFTCLCNKPFKIRIHLRRSPCNINGLHLLFSCKLNTIRHHFPGHHFRPVRSCTHMTMLARQITDTANIHLKHIQPVCCIHHLWINLCLKHRYLIQIMKIINYLIHKNLFIYLLEYLC